MISYPTFRNIPRVFKQLFENFDILVEAVPCVSRKVYNDNQE